jgi:hypothetical protein
MSMKKCPDPAKLRDLVAGGAAGRALRAHLADCPSCQAAVARLRGALGVAGLLLADAPGDEPLPPGLAERLFAKVNPVWEAAVPAAGGLKLAAQTAVPEVTPDPEPHGVCCLFVDPATGRGYVRPLYVRLEPGGPAGLRPRVACDAVMRAAVERAAAGALAVLERVGFRGAAATAPSGEWWIAGPPAQYEGASIGLGAALATVAAYCRLSADAGLVVTGAVDGDVVAPVAGVAQKWRALQGQGFQTLLLPAAVLPALPPEAHAATAPRLAGVATLTEAVAAAFGAPLGLARGRVVAVLARETPARPRIDIELRVEPASAAAGVATRAVGVRPAARPLRVGDAVRFLVRVSHACHVGLVNLATDGHVTVLLPNAHYADTQVRSGRWHPFPAEGHGFTFPLLGPPGTEKVIAVASARPLHLEPHHFGQGAAFADVGATARDVGIVEASLRGQMLGLTELEFAVAGRAEAARPRTRGGPPSRPALRSLDLPE